MPAERDWKKEAVLHLSYLDKCRTHRERIEFMAAVLSLEESKGALRASEAALRRATKSEPARAAVNQ